VGPTTNHAGSTVSHFVSNATTQYCSSADAIHSYTVPATLAPIASCGTAFDLENNLLTSYNPGWSQPLDGADWIGPNALSNEYRTNPGSYVFQTQLGSIPTGATFPTLNDTIVSDNAIAVFLNGFRVETQVITDCVGVPSSTCNWNQAFVISDNNPAHFNTGPGSTNTLTTFLVDTPNGGTPTNSYACVTNPQANGTLGFGGAAVATSPSHQANGTAWTKTMTATTGCENPAGVAFWGSLAYVPAPVLLNDQGCSPGYWKQSQHFDSYPSPTLPTTTFQSVFGINAFPGQTLLQVLSTGGGGLTAFGRHAVAAYLNAGALGTIHYGLTQAQVISNFATFYNAGQYAAGSSFFESREDGDESGRSCPLN